MGKKEGKEFNRFDVRLSFDGSGLLDHEMDAELFASSIRANAKLFKKICHLTIGIEVTPKVTIKAIEKNGVLADLALYFFQNRETIHFLANNDITQLIDDVLKLTGYALGGVGSIYGFIKWLKKRKIKKERSKIKENTVTITLDDGTQYEIDKNIYSAAIDDGVKKLLSETIEPLKKHGIDCFRLLRKYPNNTIVETESVSKLELPLFDAYFKQTDVEVNESMVVGSLDRPSYHGSTSGWNLVLPNQAPIKMTIKDKNFIANVEDEVIHVLKGDLFKINLRQTKTTHRDGSPNIKYEATNVQPYDDPR